MRRRLHAPTQLQLSGGTHVSRQRPESRCCHQCDYVKMTSLSIELESSGTCRHGAQMLPSIADESPRGALFGVHAPEQSNLVSDLSSSPGQQFHLEVE